MNRRPNSPCQRGIGKGIDSDDDLESAEYEMVQMYGAVGDGERNDSDVRNETSGGEMEGKTTERERLLVWPVTGARFASVEAATYKKARRVG